MCIFKRFCCIACAALVGLLSAQRIGATDGTVRVYTSTFNELAAAVTPLPVSGQNPVQINERVCFLGACWTIRVRICDGNWSGNVENLNFTISTLDGVKMSGVAHGTFSCVIDIPWSAVISADADVTYNSALRAILVRTSAQPVRPCVSVPAVGPLCLRSIDIGPAMTLDPVPVATTPFYFRTSTGQTRLNATPQNPVVQVENGFISLETDVLFW
jgi:hypothetical protein